VWSASRPSLYGTLGQRPNQKREDLEANLTQCRRRLALRYKGRGAVAEARADGEPNPRADNLRRPDPIDPVHITMVRLKGKEFIWVHGDHRKVTAKLTRIP
jgi:hypothetical protein